MPQIVVTQKPVKMPLRGHLIPVRTMAVTSQRDRHRNRISWSAQCFTCDTKMEFLPTDAGYEMATHQTRVHRCKTIAKDTTIVHTNANLRSGKSGTTGR